MSEQERERRRGVHRSGLFWPLLLIAIGVIFLLNNLGWMTGDLWENILLFWPLLLVLMGIDGFLRREGLVGATLAIGMGVAFLLSNLGYLNVSIWGLILRLWPLFLLAAGFDILVGRRSWLLSLAGVVLILAILAGALYFLGVDRMSGRIPTGERLSLPLESSVKQADIRLDAGAGSIRLKKMAEPVALLTGALPQADKATIVPDYSVEGDTARVVLRNTGGSYANPMASDSYQWDVELATGIPIALQIDMGAGEAALDLSGLTLSALRTSIAVGTTEVIFPATGSFTGSIDGAIGQLTIIVPPGVGVRIRTDTGLTTVQARDGFEKRDGLYESSNYNSAEYRIDLTLRLAIGNIILRTK